MRKQVQHLEVDVPIDGPAHWAVLCGFVNAYRVYFTKDKEDVTCKRCLKKMEDV